MKLLALLTMLSLNFAITNGEAASATPDPWDAVKTWTLAQSESASTEYRVHVNGVEIPVSRYQADGVMRAVAVAHFTFSGTARVQVTFSGDIPAGMIVSPRRLQIPLERSGNTVGFSLDRPRKLALQFGGRDGMKDASGHKEKLFLFADALEPELSTADGRVIVDALQSGVSGQPGAFVAERLQALLDGLPEGGTLRLGPGVYELDRRIEMRSHKHVRIEAGALVRFTSVNPGSKGMFQFDGVEHASLTGRGTLHLNGSAFRNAGAGFSTCQAVRIHNSHHIRVEGLTLRDAGNINVFVTESDDNLFRDLKIIADADFSNTDGIGLNDGCENNTVDDCFIYTTDDCAVGGWKDDMSHFTVRNCVMWNHGTGRALKVGTEFAGRRYSWFNWENCDVIYSPSMVELTWENEDGVPRSSDVSFEHFFVKNIHVETPPENRTIQVCCGKGQDLWFQNIFFSDNAEWAQGNGFRHEEWGGGRVWSRIDSATIQHLQIGGRVALNSQDAGFEHDPLRQRVKFIDRKLPEIEMSAERLVVRPGADAVFVFSRSGGVSREQRVSFRCFGSAVAGGDFSYEDTQVRFAAGQSETRIRIPTKHDARSGVSLLVAIESEMSPDWTIGTNGFAQITLHSEAPKP